MSEVRTIFHPGDDIEFEGVLQTDDGDMQIWMKSTVLEVFEIEQDAWYVIDGGRWIHQQHVRPAAKDLLRKGRK